MIRAGTRFGESKGGVDSCIEIKELEWDEPLVVIHTEDGIVVAFDCGAENGIWREGAEEAVFSSVKGVNSWDYNFSIFCSEGSIFSCMGV